MKPLILSIFILKRYKKTPPTSDGAKKGLRMGGVREGKVRRSVRRFKGPHSSHLKTLN